MKVALDPACCFLPRCLGSGRLADFHVKYKVQVSIARMSVNDAASLTSSIDNVVSGLYGQLAPCQINM